jgi:hypothetical protein
VIAHMHHHAKGSLIWLAERLTDWYSTAAPWQSLPERAFLRDQTPGSLDGALILGGLGISDSRLAAPALQCQGSACP